MSEESKPDVTTAPEVVAEDTKMDVDAKPEVADTKPEIVAEGSTAEEKKQRGSYNKLSTIPAVKDEEGTVLPEDDDENATHDLTLPKIEGLEEKDVVDLLNKAAKQVHFYFSDGNLPTDKYFFTLTICNSAGWVPLDTVRSFKRMQEFQPFGLDFITLALRRVLDAEKEENRKSEDVEPERLLVLSKDGKFARRRLPLSRPVGVFERSVYVKGFGEEETEKTQEDIERYFEQFGYKISSVRFRREDDPKLPEGNKKGAFKGSVFVEFKNVKDAEAFVAREEFPKYSEASEEPMKVMSKQGYCDMKIKEKGIDAQAYKFNRNKADRPAQGQSQGGSSGGQGGKPNAGGRNWNAFIEMARMQEGKPAAFANIPETVQIVGTRPKTGPHWKDNKQKNGAGGGDKKRQREGDDDEDSKPAKQVKLEEVEIDYLGQKIKCDPETGKPVGDFDFENDVVIQWKNDQEKGDYKEVKAKAHSVLGGETAPFVGRPPQQPFGYMAKADSKTAFTDAEIQQLNDGQITYGDSPLTFSRLDDAAQREFWATRASFYGKKAAEKAKAEAESAASEYKGKRNFGGKRGGGGGRGGRGRGGRGGRGRGGRGGRDGGRDQGAANPGLPPKVATD